jgi:hypothetical protein
MYNSSVTPTNPAQFSSLTCNLPATPLLRILKKVTLLWVINKGYHYGNNKKN